ncbi:MAG TPA: amidohydrolase family protein [Candidatus Binataceae bacterium]|nr:amidohydrolase family protein [Candidatus Binataceae bacterium]
MAALRLISADSHVMEPAEFWVERLDEKFRDRAPRVVPRPDGKGFIFTAPGISPFPVAGGFGTGRSGEELREHMKRGYEAARPSGWDPAERIKDQEVDGVEAEVLYTTLGMPLFGLPDDELQRACFHVYNEWLAEFCAYNPKRLIGTALISLEDIAAGVKELEHCAKRGLRGAMIWGSPPEDQPYSSHAYDPLWAAASELHMPLSLHVITGKSKESDTSVIGDALSGSSKRRISMGELYANLIHEVQRSLSAIIFGGVLERFPKLIIVSAENDVGWIPHYMYRLDHAYEKFNALMPDQLPMKPSEYIRRQLFATFQDDPVGPAAYKLFGSANYMWASDFPHTDSTWPESRKVVERDFSGVPDDVKRKIVFENAASLYHIN